MSEWNAKIVRVDEPQPGLLSLSLRSDGMSEALVLVMLPGVLDAGIVGERPRGARATPSITKLRRHLEGARIDSVRRSRRAIAATVRRGGIERTILAAPSRPYGAWWLCDSERTVIVQSSGAPAELPWDEAYATALSQEALRIGQEGARGIRGGSQVAAHARSLASPEASAKEARRNRERPGASRTRGGAPPEG